MNMDRVSWGSDENILELDGGYGDTTLWTIYTKTAEL